MDLFEYQGKDFLGRHHVPVPVGAVADTPDDAVAVAETLGYPVVVKAQVLVGGRGKAGGIRQAGDPDEVAASATAILGLEIGGHVVRRLWVERAVNLAREYYASFTLDRGAKTHLCMVSARGGIDIEQVAEETPDAIARLHVDPLDGLSAGAARRLVAEAGLDEWARDGAVAVLERLYEAYVGGDADLVEVNPLGFTPDRFLVALDAKVTLDDSAAFRHPEWHEYRSAEVLDARERLAREQGLNYIGLDGTVGIIGNGAGLVMSTLDVVNQVGGTAANFLDVGGGAGAGVISAALSVVNSDENVRAILINVFGGITRCDEVARGILEALAGTPLRSPIVVRLDGTNAEEGRALLADHQSERLVSQPTMLDAARKAVELASGAPA